MTRLISSHVEASKIGRQIADEVMDMQRRGGDSPLSNGTSSPPSHSETASQVIYIINYLVHNSLLHVQCFSNYSVFVYYFLKLHVGQIRPYMI